MQEVEVLAARAERSTDADKLHTTCVQLDRLRANRSLARVCGGSAVAQGLWRTGKASWAGLRPAKLFQTKHGWQEYFFWLWSWPR